MKNKSITISSSSIHDPALEELIRKRDTELKELARKNAKYFAKQNLPVADNDFLLSHTGEIKAGYEKLAGDVLHYLQPEAHFPEAKMEADYFKEKDKNLEIEMKEKEHQNNVDVHEIGNFDPSNIVQKLLAAGILTFIITIGEIIFNTRAFQIIGDNMLFALLISISVSIGILIFAHFATFLYKEAHSVFKRRAIIICSLLIITTVFYIIGILRSEYLASQDIQISPVYFLIFNLFFFILSVLVSFFMLPTWGEIKENTKHFKALRKITQRKREITKLKKLREEIKTIILEKTKERLRAIHYANYSSERIRKMYFETMEVYKSAYKTYKHNGAIPEFFSERVPEPDITIITF